MQKEPLTRHRGVLDWVDEVARLTTPDQILWIDGSEKEKDELSREAFSTGELIELNQEKLPGCVYHRTAKNDVARTENLTYICTSKKEDAGPTNNWMSPSDAYEKLGAIFRGSMKGRKMYVLPFIMGIPGSPFNKIGVEITDSIYVVLNMRIMTRMGTIAWKELGESGVFTKCLHGKADLNLDRRFICHFPEDNTIWSVGSGYGGNVLLGKKCLALRIASYLARNEGWFAEHMMIVGVENPKGEIAYIAGAFPSACGKTNLAMLIPPDSMPGYKVWTVGDDIAWMRIGSDGRLYAINPEYGFFGVAPGTNYKTNPNAMETAKRNTIFTNVLLKNDLTVWWEGMDGPVPDEGMDWKGDHWTRDSTEPGANPNSRFTAPAGQCPSISPHWEDPEGVPISAFLFGGRRASLAPLVYESLDWRHGVFVGATMASERTAAQYGKLGEVRRDPMAMIPFCGYNMGDYFGHWLSMGKKLTHPPRIYNVNWFRQDANGKFLWPGYGENLRVLKWVIDRCFERVDAVKTPIGYVPKPGDIDIKGLDINAETMKGLLSIDQAEWKGELGGLREFFEKFGDRLPEEIWEEFAALEKRLT
ncbi:MAG TPA: phosphoenolpyruvate carboxykinase (GTP) [Spirochaetota bacterium]|nr:phosphoenolpyruvate carboxykinase (GTP) [Spirochaetota bacterium]HPV96399.1 phosphoenolpyruvate carboxykinase (GTP) [Spirochaetota bacterium]